MYKQVHTHTGVRPSILTFADFVRVVLQLRLTEGRTARRSACFPNVGSKETFHLL